MLLDLHAAQQTILVLVTHSLELARRFPVRLELVEGALRPASVMRLPLVRRGLGHHWRVHAAVVLGVATAVAVLGGALLVGESVRASLREIALRRLGGVAHVVRSSGFFREALAGERGPRGAGRPPRP